MSIKMQESNEDLIRRSLWPYVEVADAAFVVLPYSIRASLNRLLPIEKAQEFWVLKAIGAERLKLAIAAADVIANVETFALVSDPKPREETVELSVDRGLTIILADKSIKIISPSYFIERMAERAWIHHHQHSSEPTPAEEVWKAILFVLPNCPCKLPFISRLDPKTKSLKIRLANTDI